MLLSLSWEAVKSPVQRQNSVCIVIEQTQWRAAKGWASQKQKQTTVETLTYRYQKPTVQLLSRKKSTKEILCSCDRANRPERSHIHPRGSLDALSTLTVKAFTTNHFPSASSPAFPTGGQNTSARWSSTGVGTTHLLQNLGVHYQNKKGSRSSTEHSLSRYPLHEKEVRSDTLLQAWEV